MRMNEKYYFIAKKDVDYSKYGFEQHEVGGEWIFNFGGLRRIWIDKKRQIHFNIVVSKSLYIFMKMIQDGVAEVRESRPINYKSRHYCILNDEELQMLEKYRKEVLL